MIFEEFSKIGIIPVVSFDNAEDSAPLAKILYENGLPCVEVELKTAAAEESIKIMTREFPDLLVGAETVLTTEQADKAINAGAKFILSPGFNPKIVQHCIDRSIPVIPGTQTPSEMEHAMEMGLSVVKFFPSEPSGGLNMIKAVAEAFVDLKFMPTGGINAKNIRDYLAYDKIIACGVNWIVKQDLTKIAAIVKEAAKIVKEIRG